MPLEMGCASATLVASLVPTQQIQIFLNLPVGCTLAVIDRGSEHHHHGTGALLHMACHAFRLASQTHAQVWHECCCSRHLWPDGSSQAKEEGLHGRWGPSQCGALQHMVRIAGGAGELRHLCARPERPSSSATFPLGAL